MSEPSTPPAVNAQIVDAVRKSTGFVYGMEQIGTATAAGVQQFNAGTSIAYEKAAQAAALAVQDATDYQRNVMSVSAVAQGKALSLMLAEPATASQYLTPYVLALVGSLAAGITASLASIEAGKALQEFPKN